MKPYKIMSMRKGKKKIKMFGSGRRSGEIKNTSVHIWGESG